MVGAEVTQLSLAGGDPFVEQVDQFEAACDPSRPRARATAVLTLGDNQYMSGTLSDYNAYYKPNWGRHDFQDRPAPGNHEFDSANAQGYRDYFGARALAFYYSYDLGSWHLISLAGDVGISARRVGPGDVAQG